jgi:hypothetical protein
VGEEQSSVDRGDIPSVKRLADLDTIRPLHMGTEVRVAEDGWRYFCIGHVQPEVAERVGWLHQNVWMPDHVVLGVRTKHDVLRDPVLTGSVILSKPSSVHVSLRSQSECYFIMNADRLRERELLASKSVELVDAVVELRQVSGGKLLRLFHLAPTTRNRGGRQLWP